MASDASPGFRPALIVVDMQEDFCIPNPLGVQGGRELVPVVNEVLGFPGFVIRVATQDFHPASHISFATNHPPPNNRPFESCIRMRNPVSGRQPESVSQRLWPIHCVQNTPGAELLPDLNVGLLDVVVKKGMDERVEMYSGFADAFGNIDCVATGGASADLTVILMDKGVTDVFVVGLAGDYCVKYTALDAAKNGFRAYMVEEGTKYVDPRDGQQQTKAQFATEGVMVVGLDSPELMRVKMATT